jgi:sensor histidine kinase YesM
MKGISILITLILFAGSLMGQSPLVYNVYIPFDSINTEQEHYNDLYQYTRVLEDPTGMWTYEEIVDRSGQFGPNTTRTDRDLEKVFWAKLLLRDPEGGKQLFSAGYPFDDYALLDIYYEKGDSLIHQRSGVQRLAAEKAIRRSGSYFWVELPRDTLVTVYLRLDNTAWKSDFWQRNPVSVYHIDPASVPDLSGAYVLLDFPEDRVAVNTWEPFFPIGFAGANPVPEYWLTEPPKIISLGRHFEFFPDPECRFTLNEVQTIWDQQAYFRGYKWPELEYNSCHWARLVVVNPKPFAQSRTFAYRRYPWQEITYFLPDSTGKYLQFTAFPNDQQMEAFSFTIPPLDTLTLFIRYPEIPYAFHGSGAMVDIPPEDLKEQQYLVKYKYFLYGGMTFVLVYFFLRLIVSRDKLFFYHFLSLIGSFTFLLIMLDDGELLGFTQILYLQLPNPGRSVFTALAGTFGNIGILNYTGIVLQLDRTFPLYDRIRKYTIWVLLIQGLILIVFEIWYWETLSFEANGFHQFLHILIYNFYTLIAGFILLVSSSAAVKKVPLSRNFLIALLPFGFGVFFMSDLFLFIPPLVKYFLFTAGLVLPTMLFGLIAAGRSNLLKLEKAQASQQKTQLENQLLQIEAKALRAQMNPHFIFNCLNSIKSLIQDKANKQAVHYLTLFSKFIRQVLHHSEEKQISLEDELEMSGLYIEMEKLRFEKSFTYKVEIDPTVDTSFFKVPPMILQPFLENAIWHGLMHKEGEREIRLIVQSAGEGVKCIVEDNGIGRERAATLNLSRQHQHRSFGTRLILDRLKVNKELFNSHFVVDIIDKMPEGRAGGTRVELSLGG